MIAGRDLGKKLCEVFSLDPNKITSMTLRAESDTAASLTVEYNITTHELNHLQTILTEYKLCNKE